MTNKDRLLAVVAECERCLSMYSEDDYDDAGRWQADCARAGMAREILSIITGDKDHCTPADARRVVEEGE